MNKKIAYVGIDYHKNTLTIAVRLEGEKRSICCVFKR